MERIQKTKCFKLLAVLLVIAMVITSIPVGVYAGQIGGINTGSSTMFSNPSSNPEAKFGGFSVEGVRCYIYDKSSDNILESEVFQGKKAIDFLGYLQEVQDMYNNVEEDDIDTATAFGEIDSLDELEVSFDYPFEFDGDKYYYAHYIYDESNNKVVSRTKDTNEKLKENNGEELSNIIHKYWGDTIDKEFKRNSNLMFITEPIFIVSYVTGEETTDTDEFDNGAFYYQSGSVTNDYEVEKYVYFTVDKGGRCSAGEQKIIYSGNNLDTSVQAEVQDIDSDTAFTELKEILTEEQYSDVLSDYQDDYIDHFEKAVWYEEYSETTNYYR